MVRPFQFTLLTTLVVLSVRAQNAPAPLAPPPAVTPAGGGTVTALGAEKRSEIPAPHAISPEVAAQLAASRPKFSPVAPPPPAKPEEELPDLRETDKPKNTIVRLPKFVVQEPKPPVFTERALAPNPKALAQIAMRRYFTEADRAMNRFQLPLFSPMSSDGLTSNERRALAMYYEDERLRNMADVADNTNMVMKSDAAAGKKMQDVSRQTFMRWQDFGWNGGDKK